MTSKLTAYQLQVFVSRCRGDTMKQVASARGCSEKAAYDVWYKVCRRFKITCIEEAIHYALFHGIVKNIYQSK